MSFYGTAIVIENMPTKVLKSAALASALVDIHTPLQSKGVLTYKWRKNNELNLVVICQDSQRKKIVKYFENCGQWSGKTLQVAQYRYLDIISKIAGDLLPLDTDVDMTATVQSFSIQRCFDLQAIIDDVKYDSWWRECERRIIRDLNL